MNNWYCFLGYRLGLVTQRQEKNFWIVIHLSGCRWILRKLVFFENSKYIIRTSLKLVLLGQKGTKRFSYTFLTEKYYFQRIKAQPIQVKIELGMTRDRNRRYCNLEYIDENANYCSQTKTDGNSLNRLILQVYIK